MKFTFAPVVNNLSGQPKMETKKVFGEERRESVFQAGEENYLDLIYYYNLNCSPQNCGNRLPRSGQAILDYLNSSAMKQDAANVDIINKN